MKYKQLWVLHSQIFIAGSFLTNDPFSKFPMILIGALWLGAAIIVVQNEIHKGE